jgi:uncharacterized RDD family membrane protein YckC
MAGGAVVHRYCSSCGAAIADDAAFCDACGSKLQPPAVSRAAAAAPTAVATYTYAGFLRRAAAYIVDAAAAIVLGALVGLMWGFVALVILYVAQGDQHYTSGREFAPTMTFWLLFMLGWLAAFFWYHLLATARGGGFGKRLLGMRIVRESDGAAPGLGSAFLRILIPVVLAWMSSGIGSLLDYAWALWDPRRQTLHDKAAGTLVVDVSRAAAPDAARPVEPAPAGGVGTGLRPGAGRA